MTNKRLVDELNEKLDSLNEVKSKDDIKPELKTMIDNVITALKNHKYDTAGEKRNTCIYIKHKVEDELF